MKSSPMIIAALAIGLLAGLGACNDATPKKEEKTAVQGNVKAVRDTIWIDVRTPEEFAEGHLPESYNIPLQEFERLFPQQVKDNNAIVALSCRSGNRSGKALSMAQAMGYTRAFNAGGYAALKQSRQAP